MGAWRNCFFIFKSLIISPACIDLKTFYNSVLLNREFISSIIAGAQSRTKLVTTMSRLFGLVVFAACAGMAKAHNDTIVHGWQPEPDGRGSWSIVWSCLVTVFLCTWSALHLKVPKQHGSWYVPLTRIPPTLCVPVLLCHPLFCSWKEMLTPGCLQVLILPESRMDAASGHGTRVFSRRRIEQLPYITILPSRYKTPGKQ